MWTFASSVLDLRFIQSPAPGRRPVVLLLDSVAIYLFIYLVTSQ